jgi:hypothetical protein
MTPRVPARWETAGDQRYWLVVGRRIAFARADGVGIADTLSSGSRPEVLQRPQSPGICRPDAAFAPPPGGKSSQPLQHSRTAQFGGKSLAPRPPCVYTIRINTHTAKHRVFGNSPDRMRGPAGRPRCVVFARRRPQMGSPTTGLSPMEITDDKTLRQLVCAQVQSPEHDRPQARSATQQKWDYVAKNALRDIIPLATKPKAPGRSRLSEATSVPLPSPLALATSPTAAPVPGSCESRR